MLACSSLWSLQGKRFNLPETAVFSNRHLFHCSAMENLKQRLDCFWRLAHGGEGSQTEGGMKQSTVNKSQENGESGDN